MCTANKRSQLAPEQRSSIFTCEISKLELTHISMSWRLSVSAVAEVLNTFTAIVRPVSFAVLWVKQVDGRLHKNEDRPWSKSATRVYHVIILHCHAEYCAIFKIFTRVSRTCISALQLEGQGRVHFVVWIASSKFVMRTDCMDFTHRLALYSINCSKFQSNLKNHGRTELRSSNAAAISSATSTDHQDILFSGIGNSL